MNLLHYASHQPIIATSPTRGFVHRPWGFRTLSQPQHRVVVYIEGRHPLQSSSNQQRASLSPGCSVAGVTVSLVQRTHTYARTRTLPHNALTLAHVHSYLHTHTLSTIPHQ